MWPCFELRAPAREAKNPRVSEPCPRAGRRQHLLGRLNHAGKDWLFDTLVGKTLICSNESRYGYGEVEHTTHSLQCRKPACRRGGGPEPCGVPV